MPKSLCMACKKTIRRPIDHVFCPGIRNKAMLIPIKPQASEREITREIKIPDWIRR